MKFKIIYKTNIFRSIILLLLLIGVSGCQKYGSVSPVAYEIAKSLYSICNRQDENKLPVVEKVVTEKLESTDLTESEYKWLMAIVDKAKSNQWEQAMLDSRLMMEEQIR